MMSFSVHRFFILIICALLTYSTTSRKLAPRFRSDTKVKPHLHEARTATNYTVGNANRMCQYALASYCCGNLGHGVADWSCKACKMNPVMSNITVFSSSIFTFDANGFVGYDSLSNAIVIAFAGTDPLSITDWIDDIDTIKTPYPACEDQGCEVHKGFYETYQSVSDQIWDAIEKIWDVLGSRYYAQIQVTGHSLGAALATHCVLDIYDTALIQPEYIYTFGQPRVGNEAFELYYHGLIINHMRITHHRDPVPHLPGQSFGFHHMAREYFYEHLPNGTYTICDGSGEDPHCSDQYDVAVDILDHLDYMGYDFTTNYLSCKL